MTTAVITNHNKCTAVHEAFMLNNLVELCNKFNLYFFVIVLDDTPIIQHKNITYIRKTTHKQLKVDIDHFLAKVKPSKVVNLLENYLPWDLVETDAEKIYFLRSCDAKLLQVLNNAGAPPVVTSQLNVMADRESRYINISDTIITDSPTSQQSLMEMYGLSSEICLEYINPYKYNQCNVPTNRKSCYNVGRRDFQKGLQHLKSPTTFEVISIGGNEADKDEYIVDNVVKIPFSQFNEYKELIKDSMFGLFPSIWESNGYAVQECLSMGKIPVVQKNSGGNERLLTPENSITVDFKTCDWEEVLDNIENTNIMMEHAKNTLTQKMYEESLNKFIRLIC